MASEILKGVIKQMVDKFPGVGADELIATMKKQPQAGRLFGMMASIGITEGELKKMIGDEISGRRKP